MHDSHLSSLGIQVSHCLALGADRFRSCGWRWVLVLLDPYTQLACRYGLGESEFIEEPSKFSRRDVASGGGVCHARCLHGR